LSSFDFWQKSWDYERLKQLSKESQTLSSSLIINDRFKVA